MMGNVRNCCNFAIAAFDGVYDWVSEAAAIIAFVIIFNFLIKWLLWRLHLRFEKQKKYWQDSFVCALYLPFIYFVWFFAAIQSIGLISSKIYKEWSTMSRHEVLAVGAILALAWFLMRWKRNIVQHIISKSKTREIAIDQGKIAAIDKVAAVAIIFFILLLLLEVTHQNINTLIAFGGIGGLALAFASQEIIANFFGGFMVYLTQPFTIGDSIIIPAHSIEGSVEEIGWYMTRIRSPDKRPIHIPNSIFSKLIVITPSRMSHRQIKMNFEVRVEDLQKIKRIVEEIKELLQAYPQLDRNLPLLVHLSGIGQYSLEIALSAYTQITDINDFMKIQEDILIKVLTLLDKNGAELATPVQNINLMNSP